MSELRARAWCTGVTRLSPDHNAVHLQADPADAVNESWSFALPVLNLSLTVTDEVAAWLRGGVVCELTLTAVTQDAAPGHLPGLA